MPELDQLVYKADITAGSLKLRESRIIADLLIRNATEAEWKDLVNAQNILQVKNPETAIRYVRLIRQRLELMTDDLWILIRDGSSIVATHAIFAAAVKHSRLLGDFLYLSVGDYYRMFKPALTHSTWSDFIEDCSGRDPGVINWSDSTRIKLKNVVYHILIQVGYLENKRTLKLQKVRISPEVLRYLKENQEDHVLKCLEVSR